MTFFHLNKLGTKIKHISGHYVGYYPEILFSEKTSRSYVDIELCKRTAAYLAGDISGIGMSLRKTHNPEWVNFLLTFDTESTFMVFSRYRKLLEKNFENKWHPLEI